MSEPRPELGTLGALLRFAVDREVSTAEQYEALTVSPGAPVSSAELAAEHRTRAERLGRLLREQLNEMILEPISGLQAQHYTSEAGSVAESEAALARLYTDIVDHAGHIFPSAIRTLTRFAERSRVLVG